MDIKLKKSIVSEIKTSTLNGKDAKKSVTLKTKKLNNIKEDKSWD
jgi:hypothetical protein